MGAEDGVAVQPMSSKEMAAIAVSFSAFMILEGLNLSRSHFGTETSEKAIDCIVY